MEHSRIRKPSSSQSEGTRPGDRAFLAPTANSTPPERKHPIPKHTQTRDVSRYRVVVEVAFFSGASKSFLAADRRSDGEQGSELHLLIIPGYFPHASQPLGHTFPALCRVRVG